MPNASKPPNARRTAAASRRRDRQLQRWAAESRDPAFVARCRQQAQAIAAGDPAGDELMDIVSELYEWPED